MSAPRKPKTLVCPICLTGYMVGFGGRGAGDRCGDLSKQQKTPCVGRLMPAADFDAADWVLPHEYSAPDPRSKIRKG